MDNDNHWSMYFDDVEMPITNDMNPNVFGFDFKIITHIQEQIKLQTQVAAMTILFMVANASSSNDNPFYGCICYLKQKMSY